MINRVEVKISDTGRFASVNVLLYMLPITPLFASVLDRNLTPTSLQGWVVVDSKCWLQLCTSSELQPNGSIRTDPCPKELQRSSGAKYTLNSLSNLSIRVKMSQNSGLNTYPKTLVGPTWGQSPHKAIYLTGSDVERKFSEIPV